MCLCVCVNERVYGRFFAWPNSVHIHIALNALGLVLGLFHYAERYNNESKMYKVDVMCLHININT